MSILIGTSSWDTWLGCISHMATTDTELHCISLAGISQLVMRDVMESINTNIMVVFINSMTDLSDITIR